MSNILDNEIAATEEVLSGESSVVASPIRSKGRTDIHRPSAIIPANYEFVAFDYYGSSDLGAIMALQTQREIFRLHMESTKGTYAAHQNSGSCHICGASALYVVRWYCKTDNSYITTGEDCARKMDMLSSFASKSLGSFRKSIADAREQVAGKRKAQALLGDAGLSRCWDLAVAESRDAYQWEENTICDIVGKFVHYGSISDKQKSFLGILLNKIDNRAAIQAQRAAESDAAAPCPTGRVKISGTVLSVKVVEGSFGDVTKILVKSDTGFKVWGSRFSITGTDGGVQKDQHVEFVATVEPSKDDPKFGFFKRPVVSLPELSAEDKKAVRMLKRISKRMVYGNDTCAAIGLIDGLAQTIKNPYDEYTREQLARWNS